MFFAPKAWAIKKGLLYISAWILSIFSVYWTIQIHIMFKENITFPYFAYHQAITFKVHQKFIVAIEYGSPTSSMKLEILPSSAHPDIHLYTQIDSNEFLRRVADVWCHLSGVKHDFIAASALFEIWEAHTKVN